MKKLLLSAAFLLSLSAAFAQTTVISGATGAGLKKVTTPDSNTLVTIAGKTVNIATADAADIAAGTAGALIDAAQLKTAAPKLGDGEMFVGNASGTQKVTMDGDATLANDGIITLKDLKVTQKVLEGFSGSAATSATVIGNNTSVQDAIKTLDTRTLLNSKTLVRDEFTALGGDVSFDLTNIAIDFIDVNIYVNGVLTPKKSTPIITNAGTAPVVSTVAYDATNNYSYPLAAGDKVSITYYK